MPIQPKTKPNPAALAHGNYEAPPLSTIAEIQAKLARYDRSPITEFLGLFLAHLPKGDTIDKLAKDDLHKFIKSASMLMAMSGFPTEKTEHRHTISLEHMSDMELLQFIRAQEKAIPLLSHDSSGTLETVATPITEKPSITEK